MNSKIRRAQKREKRNVPEFTPQVQQYIERVHRSKEAISEKDIKKIKIIKRCNFKNLLSDYLYEINFPKDSEIKEIKYLNTPNLYTITFPGSLTRIEPSSFKKCEFLQQILFIKDENEKNNLTFIGEHAFDNTIIQSICIPDSIKTIGSFCFPSTLKQIDFENGAPHLEEIQDEAFKNTQIESINLPLDVKSFSKSKKIFFGCNNLKTIIFDHYVNKEKLFSNEWDYDFDEIKDLADNLMLSQTNIKKLEIFKTNVNYFLFYNTPKLNEITIPKSDNAKFIKLDGCLYTKNKKKLIVAERNVKDVKICPECQIITNYAFNVKSLEKVSLNDNSQLKKISFLAFYESNIKDINIPDFVELIDYGTFLNCKNLNEIKIPHSLSFIENSTFSGTNLREITIPKNITKICYGSFFNCTQLQIVKFENGSKLNEIEDLAFSNTKIESISIPSTVTNIGNYCFANCHYLKSFKFDIFQSNLIEIGNGCFLETKIDSFQLPKTIKKFDFSLLDASTVSFSNFSTLSYINNFYGSKIKQISIPSTIEKICPYAFFDCVNLTEVKIIDLEKSKLDTISHFAFYNCTNLTDFKLSNKVKLFGLCSFKNCVKYMAKIECNDKECEMTIDKSAFENSGIVSFKSKSKSIKVNDFSFKDCKNLTDFESISSSKCIFGSSVFIDCSALKSVKLSLNAQVVKIGENCFLNSSIQSFEVPYELKYIPKCCFKNCTKLTEFIIPENSQIDEFSAEAFAKSGLKSIFIPCKTKKIKKHCFLECKSLKKLTFSEDIQSCTLYSEAFYMSGIEELDLIKGIKEIGIGCFQNCSNLKKLNFSDDLTMTTIKEKVFKSSGIEELTLPPSFSSVNKSAFKNCKNLRKVSFLGDDVAVSIFAFADCLNLKSVDYELVLTITTSSNHKIHLFDEKIEQEMIEPLFVSKEPLFYDFRGFVFGYFLLVNEKWNSRNYFLNRITSLVNEKSKDYYIYEKYGSGYYINGRKKLINCDISAESICISKEAEIITARAFKESNLKSVKFENNSKLSIIDNFAFDITQIKEISLPNSLTIIGNWAFNHCHLLSKVDISPDSKLETIGRYAFCGTAIESILFPSSLISVNEFAFYQCSMLTTVDNQSNQVKFKKSCFALSSVENIKFPQQSTFGRSSFQGCSKLKQLQFIDEPTDIKFKEDSFAFSGLEEIRLKCDVFIEDNAFQDCKSLKKIVLSGKINKINASSFSNCDIKTVIFDKEIETTNNYIFKIGGRMKPSLNDPIRLDYFNDLFKSNIEQASFKLNIIEKVAQQKNTYHHEHDFFLNHKCYVVNNTLVYANMINNALLYEKQTNNDDDDELKKNEILRIPSNVKRLDFPPMRHIKRINWGANGIVEDLGPPGFFSYYNLTKIVIPKLVKVIPPKLFASCYYLSYVAFEKGSILEIVGDFSFQHTRVTKVVFPNSTLVIGKSAFYDVKYLQEVSFNGQIIGDEAFSNTGLKSFKLSNNTTNIGSYAFHNCTALNTFIIDINKSNLSEIGKHAFSESSIKEIQIPPKVKTIEKFTFNGCKYLKEVIFSDNSSLESIQSHSFSGNLSLEKINLPKTIRKLSYKAFINTPSLKSIMNESNQLFNVMKNKAVYKKDQSLIFVPRSLQQFQINEKCSVIRSGSFCGPNLSKVVLSNNNLVNIGQLSFAHCTALKEITIPKSVLKIGNECFIGCENLEKVEFELPCKIKEIPKLCFAFSGLKTIHLPESIEIINHSSFLLCMNLKTINLFDSYIKYIGDCAFSGTNIEEVKFPTSLQFIGNNAFGGIKSLAKIDFSELAEIEDMAYKTKKEFICILLKKENLAKALINEKDLVKLQQRQKNPIESFNDEDLNKSANDEDLNNENIESDENNNLDNTYNENTDINESVNDENLNNEIIESDENKINDELEAPNIADNESQDKNDQINETNKVHFAPSDHKVLKQSSLIFKPTISSSPSKNLFASPLASSKSIETLPQSPIQKLNFPFKLDNLPDVVDESSNNTNETIRMLQETIRKLQKENLEQKQIIKSQQETIVRQEEIIRKLRGESDENDDKKSNDEEQKEDKNANKNADESQVSVKFSDKVENENDNEKENEKTLIPSRPKDPNSCCIVHQNAFYNDSINILKFDLKEYKWFFFFDKFNKINEYIANEDIHLVIQKLPKQNNKDCLISKLKWSNQEKIPILRDQYLEEFSISRTTRSLFPYHFSNCCNLTKIEFDEGINIRLIPRNCFADTPLKKIKIPSSVRCIGNSAFFSCCELEEICFSDDSKLHKINENAFCKCEKLEKIDLPKSIKIISKNCFSFTCLKKIEIPSSVKKIDSMAFFNCKNLSQISIKEGLQEIGDLSFAFNISLKSIDLPDSLKIIKFRAFYNCSNLQKVKTTKNTQLVEIYDDAFRCTQIDEISVNQMATKLFDPVNIPNLNKINFFNGKPLNFVQLKDGTIYEKDKNDSFQTKEFDISEFEEKNNELIFQNSIYSNSYAIKSYYNFKTKYQSCLHNYSNNGAEENYNKNAFDIMLKKNRSRFSEEEKNKNPILRLLFVPKNLETLKIHEDCFSISASACERLKDLTTIEFINGSTNFVFDFPYHDHILKVRILGDYSYIKRSAFARFESLEIVEFGPKTNVPFISKYSFYECKKLKKIIIPDSCFSIEKGAFENCISLSSVEFGSKLKCINNDAFCNCSSLESITIPSNVVLIGEQAFMDCTKLKNINMIFHDENGIEIIGKSAFKNCTSLKSFTLPKTCIVLGPCCFMNCTNLEKFEYEGQYLFSIQCRTFFNCNSLKCIKMLHLRYKEFDKNDRSFYMYSFMQENKNLEEGKEKNEDRNVCNNFKSYFSIDAEAFMNCTLLQEVVIEDQSKKNGMIELNEKNELIFNYPCHGDYMDINYYYHEVKKNYGLITLRQSVQKRAFCNCKSLARISLFLGNLEHFHEKAFMNCSSLKEININSKYSRYLLTESMYVDPFVATSKNLVINVFIRDKCVKTINANSIKPKINEKRHFADHLSFLNESFITNKKKDGEDNNIKKKKPKTK